MKKHFIKLFILISFFVFVPFCVYASSNFLLSSDKETVSKGDTFDVKIYVNPNGTKDYTSKIKLKFPPNLLSIKNFNYAFGWMPITMNGYDVLDNTNGILIKSAGFPNGILNETLFGTITFEALSSGSNALIGIDNSSLILDSDSKNALDLKNLSSKFVKINKPEIISVEENIAIENTQPESTSSLVASVADSGVGNDLSKKIMIIFNIILLIVSVYVFAWRPFWKK